MLEGLNFVLEGCVGEGTKDSDRICSVELKRIVAERGLWRSGGGHLLCLLYYYYCYYY